MTPSAYSQNHFTPEEIATFEPIMKIGLLATISPQGLPHLTLLSSLKAASDKTLTWGQFTEGMSFQNVRKNPKIGWLVMTLDKDLWRGTGVFTHTATSGPDFDWYNQVPMFRYNAYFGIHTVYTMDLVHHTGKSPLPMPRIIRAAIKTKIAKAFFKHKSKLVMNAWTRGIFDKLDNLKFLTYITKNGYPTIIPVIQTQSAGANHLIFSTGAYTAELRAIPKGTPMALFGLCLDMTDVLTRGTYQGMQQVGPHHCGVMVVDWVYSPMPPVPQQIYPPVPLEAVTTFE